MKRLANALQLTFCLCCLPFLMAVLLCFIAGEWLVTKLTPGKDAEREWFKKHDFTGQTQSKNVPAGNQDATPYTAANPPTPEQS